MTTDKNGKELKVGDWVIFHPEPGKITWLFSDGDIELDDNDSGWRDPKHCTYVSPENLEKILAPAPVEITYTTEDMYDAFVAGRVRSDYEADVFDVGYSAPDFAQFMDGLNTYKSMP